MPSRAGSFIQQHDRFENLKLYVAYDRNVYISIDIITKYICLIRMLS